MCIFAPLFMANDFFNFKRFTVWQQKCAMKVGTDSTLLGAWAQGGRRILDIGTGTGLLALMMAQRYDEAEVVGIDIDEKAVSQACDNVKASPFANRIVIEHADISIYGCVGVGEKDDVKEGLQTRRLYDAIVCNPPYFVNALTSPDEQRTLARHTASLTYEMLMRRAWELLDDNGVLSVVIPFDCKSRLESEAVIRGFFKTREWAVKTTERKASRRYLLAFRKHPTEIEKRTVVIGDATYEMLTKDFYL